MEIKGTVKYIDLEIGFWGIETADGEKFIPVNMPEQLKNQGREVEITAELSPDLGGLHMWGTYIKILSFET